MSGKLCAHNNIAIARRKRDASRGGGLTSLKKLSAWREIIESALTLISLKRRGVTGKRVRSTLGRRMGEEGYRIVRRTLPARPL
jgi:hypothetical protein